jgi:hypothetical protein
MKPTLVHIDLKGAPFKADPTCSFWPEFCRLIAKWGVSGLLMEWEDSVRIPTLYSDPLPDFAYDRNQVTVSKELFTPYYRFGQIS